MASNCGATLEGGMIMSLSRPQGFRARPGHGLRFMAELTSFLVFLDRRRERLLQQLRLPR
jgi:hypothetical protein